MRSVAPRERLISAAVSLLLAGLTLGAVPVPSRADVSTAAVPNRPTARPIPLDRPKTVTLITGDEVTLVPTASGEPRVVLPAGDFAVHRDPERIEVVPHEVRDLVPEVLDPALFDVTALAAMGYDDAGSSSIPLIVHRAPGVGTLRADPALKQETALASIRANAVRLDKARAEEFGEDLADLAARPGPATSAAAADDLGGIDRIWLDAQVTTARAPRTYAAPTVAGGSQVSEVELDPYLIQIGASEAWATGLDGSGVTAAVLDTGIDAGHPALTGQVVGSYNSTDAGSAGDVQGHGTHVASLLAGTGAGSDGARRGVAPGADLLNVKVLGDDGSGQLSWVIAGMEWAVGKGADIVNLSLSTATGVTDDPVVQALDALAAESGTLFVVAAGNSGWYGVQETVSSPGTATSALTVGAVDVRDGRPTFSGLGPAKGSYRAKPDLVAPGVNILGARAEARYGGDLYLPDTGTSMAAPIVAGAAALTMQQHPDWTWAQVKSAVATSADLLSEPWGSGAGRLALEHLVDTDVIASPSTISPGPALHPFEGQMTTTVTLTNTATSARTYTASDVLLSPRGTASPVRGPEAGLTVTPATVVVAPGASAAVEVTFDASAVPDGYWHGVVELTGDDGSSLRLPFASFDETERYWLDISVIDRDGAPYAGGAVPLLNTVTGGYTQARLDENGKARLRVDPGTYSAVAIIETDEAAGATTTVAGDPGLEIDADTSLRIDARDGEPLRPPVVPGQRTRPSEVSLNWYAARPNGGAGYGDGIVPPIEDVIAGRVLVAPAAEVSSGEFNSAIRWRLEPEGRRSLRTPDGYELAFTERGLPHAAAPVLDSGDVRDLAEVTEHYYAARPGETVLRGLVAGIPGTLDLIHRREVPAPGTETVLMTARAEVRWNYDSIWVDEGPQRLVEVDPVAFAPGARLDRHFRRGLHVSLGHGSAFRDESMMFVVQGLSDGPRDGDIDQTKVESATTALYADGEIVSRGPGTWGYFPVPAGPRLYRLEGDVRMADGLRTKTAWTFRSEAPKAGQADDLPILDVDYRPTVDLLNTSRRGKDLRFDLRIDHLPGAETRDRISSARLQWSTDGGRTWHEASVRRIADAAFAAKVKGTALRSGDAVSVRLRASDVDGNTIDQTVWGLVALR